VNERDASDLINRIQPHLLAAPPYVPVEPPDEVAQRIGVAPDQIVKLDANENPYGPSPKVAEVLTKAQTIHVYPDPEQRKVRAALGRYIGYDPEWIMAGAGSDELLNMMIRMFVPMGGSILDFPPTFNYYPFLVGVQGGNVTSVQRRPDYTLDTAATLEEIKKANLTLIATPNNPTGTVVPNADIETLARTGAPLVIDEAYAEFAGESCVSLVCEYPNLVVMRTLSKWAGLAGLRVGFMVAHPDLIDVVLRIKDPYNLNAAAEAALLATMDDLPYLQGRIDAMIAEKRRMETELAKRPGIEVVPSDANFLLCKLTQVSARDVHARMLQRGILLRYFDTPLLSNMIRISAGRPDQTDALLVALDEVMTQAAPAEKGAPA
jgi:histidinol-phosphate aminotransferase